MNKYYILLFFILLLNSLNGQTKFEKGYFIDNDDNRIECLIKNQNKKNTPQGFLYKLKEGDPAMMVAFHQCKEFGIGENQRFEKHPVSIDRSKNFTESLSDVRQAIFETDTLFLETLIKGEISLYHFQDKGLNRFFYQKGNYPLVQLVYKKYSTKNKVGTNNRYRQQLKVNFECSNSELKTENINYNRKQLTSVIENYNTCNNFSFQKFEKEKLKLLNMGLKLELMNESMQCRKIVSIGINNRVDKVFKFENSNILQYGLYLEYVLPFNNNKWSLFIEPSYQEISKEVQDTFSLTHRSIEIPLGFRYYYLITPNSKLSINASYLMDVLSKTEVQFKYSALNSENVSGNFAFGLGYDYKRFGIDLRYKLGKNLMGKFATTRTLFRGAACSMRFRLY